MSKDQPHKINDIFDFSDKQKEQEAIMGITFFVVMVVLLSTPFLSKVNLPELFFFHALVIVGVICLAALFVLFLLYIWRHDTLPKRVLGFD